MVLSSLLTRVSGKAMMKTIHIDPSQKGDARQKLSTLRETIEELLDGDKPVAITVAEEGTLLSPQQAADRLGFSRQHVRRLIEAEVLEGETLPNSTHWKIPLRAVLAFEENRADAETRADEFSRSLDRIGAAAE
jgi:excisionase family DNA binding protein